MKHFICIIVICVTFLAACSPGYKKAGRGYEYKIIPGGNEKKLQYGNFVEFDFKQVYHNGTVDTVLGDTREYMPRILAIDSTFMPPAYITALTDAAKADSIVLRISSDSAHNQPDQQTPKYIKPGGFIYTTIKIHDVFTNREMADSASRAELRINGLKIYTKQLKDFDRTIDKDRPQIEADSKIISAWLDKNNIKYIKGRWGTFVAIHDEGTGKKIEYNDVAGVYYTGKTFDSGKVFNSNIDPRFHNTEMYEVTLSRPGSVIPGWTDALMLLREGAKATIYIPSSLAFGKKGFLPQIKPNENIVFDIEVKKVITEDRALEIVSENRRRGEAAQRKQADSLKKNH